MFSPGRTATSVSSTNASGASRIVSVSAAISIRCPETGSPSMRTARVSSPRPSRTRSAGGRVVDPDVVADAGAALDADVAAATAAAGAGTGADAGMAAGAGVATDPGVATDVGVVADPGAATDAGVVADPGAAAGSGVMVDPGAAVGADAAATAAGLRRTLSFARTSVHSSPSSKSRSTSSTRKGGGA